MVGMYLTLISSSLQRKKRSPEAMKRGRGRGKRRRKGENSAMPEIPWEIQMEILIRLPCKSLMRFKCVSKLWSSLIRCRYFTNRYYHLTAASPPRRLYMSLVEHLNCDSMEVCHNPGKSFLLSFSSSSSGNIAEPLDLDLTMPGMGGHYMVALRGLLLYIVCRKACIYNPATRQSITLPAFKSDMFAQEKRKKHVFYSFGHDPVLDQYKVVCNVVLGWDDCESMTSWESECWVFVVQAGGFWKKVEFYGQPHVPTRVGMCINGVIYYMASTCVSRDIVVSFDVRSEEFSTLEALSESCESVGFIEYGGKPTIIDHTHLLQTGWVNLWVLEDGGKWSTKSLVLQPCQMHLVVDDNYTIDRLKVHGTTQNREVILAPIPSRSYLLYYDVQKNDLRKVNFITGDWVREFSKSYIDFKHMDKSESIMHLET